MNEFAKFLEETGISMKWLSDRFGIPYRTIQRWKAGDNPCPAYVLKMIKEIMHVDNDQK